MSVPAVMGAVTVRRSGGTTPHGDPLPAVDHEQPGCAWAPRTSSELTDLRETVIVGYWLFGPHDADVQPTDQVLISGVVDGDGEQVLWQVDGEPGRWISPHTGREVGMQVALRRAHG